MAHSLRFQVLQLQAQDEINYPISINCQSRIQIPARFKTSATPAPVHPLANSALISTLPVHCQWEDETAGERTGHPPSYAEAKKMKLLTLHTQYCLRGILI